MESLLISSRIDRVTDLLGRPLAVMIAVACVVGWAIAGPFLHFSDRWQVTVQTGTAIVTFLMIFCVQLSKARAMSASDGQSRSGRGDRGGEVPQDRTPRGTSG
jgi:low affinity Fe/Cu permease